MRNTTVFCSCCNKEYRIKGDQLTKDIIRICLDCRIEQAKNKPFKNECLYCGTPTDNPKFYPPKRSSFINVKATRKPQSKLKLKIYEKLKTKFFNILTSL